MCFRFDQDTMPDPMLLPIATSQADEADDAQPVEAAAGKKQVLRLTYSGVLAECSGDRCRVVCSNGHKHTTLQLLWQRKITICL